MAIPENFIDKFTDVDSGERRDICPAADKVRVDNDNFEGADLDEVLDEIAEAINDAGEGGYTPPQGGIPKTDLSSDVQSSLGKADTAYQKPASGIPASDLASGVIPDVSGLATKTEVNTGLASKANAADIPTKVSELLNDEGFITAAALADVVVGSGDFAMTYDEATDTFNIVRLVPTLQVTPLSSMSASTKSGTFKVSGTNLKGDVTIALPQGASNWLLSTGGGAGASSLTLSPTNGTLAETTITVAYSGSTDSVGNTITISSTGAESKTVTATYTEHAGPTITTSNAGISISEVGGYQNTATLQITGVMLTGNITAALSGTNASKFSLSKSTFTQNDGTVNDTLTITYKPSASDTGSHSATLTLSSTGATSVVIALTGTVLSQSLSVSPSTLSFESAVNQESVAKTLTVTGTNLKNDVTISVPAGFAAKVGGNTVSSLAKADVMASGGVTVSVTALGTVASGTLGFSSITLASTTLSQNVSLGWTEQEPAPAVNSYKIVGNVRYRFRSSQNNGVADNCAVAKPEGGEWDDSTYAGNITIPEYITVAGNQYPIKMIDVRAFYKASNLVSVDLSAASQLTNVQDYSFYGTAITELDIASGVTELANNSLQNCPSLTKLTLRYNGVVKIYGDTLGGTTQNLSEVFVPSGQIASYEADQNQYSNNTYGWKNKNVVFKPITE